MFAKFFHPGAGNLTKSKKLSGGSPREKFAQGID